MPRCPACKSLNVKDYGDVDHWQCKECNWIFLKDTPDRGKDVEKPGCPKCGGATGYETHDYFSGWAEFLGMWDRRDEECLTFNDTVVLRRASKTAKCLDCGKKVDRPFERGE